MVVNSLFSLRDLIVGCCVCGRISAFSEVGDLRGWLRPSITWPLFLQPIKPSQTLQVIQPWQIFSFDIQRKGRILFPPPLEMITIILRATILSVPRCGTSWNPAQGSPGLLNPVYEYHDLTIPQEVSSLYRVYSPQSARCWRMSYGSPLSSIL